MTIERNLTVVSVSILIYHFFSEWYYLPPGKAEGKVNQHGFHIDHQSVDEIRWSDIYPPTTTDIETEFVALRAFMSKYTTQHPRRPVVIRHDDDSFIARHWKVLQKWKPSHFQYGARPQRRTLGVFEIYSQIHPVFKTFHDDKPLELYLSSKSLHFDDFNDLKLVRSFTEHIFASESYDEMTGNKDTVYSYYADKIDFLSNYFPELEDDFIPHREWIEDSAWIPIQNLMANHSEIEWMRSDLENVITVRFSGSNQETFMHFDAVWNTFIQIHGHKQFILSSPRNVMYKYPVLHPHSGHSQLDHVWNHTDYSNTGGTGEGKHDMFSHFGMDIIEELQCHRYCGNRGAISLFVVDLQPGDILLIPPYWWHHVISETESISMHFWLNSIEFLMANREIYALPLPFELEWTSSVKIYLFRFFFKLIVSPELLGIPEFRTVYGVDMSQLVLRQLFRLRYEPLLIKEKVTINGVIDEEVQNICQPFHIMPNIFESDIAMKDWFRMIGQGDKESIGNMLEMDINDERIADVLAAKYRSTAETVRERLMLIEDEASRLLLLQNYMEYALNGVLGTEYVFPFLAHCTKF